MNEQKKQKISRFMTDEAMSEAVYEVMLDSFMKPKADAHDIRFLAASRIAIDLLNDAWKELKRFKVEADREPRQNKNPGL